MRTLFVVSALLIVGGAVGASMASRSASESTKRAALASATEARDRAALAIGKQTRDLVIQAENLADFPKLRAGVTTDAPTVQDLVKDEGLSILADADLYEVWSRGEAAPQLFAMGGKLAPEGASVVGAAKVAETWAGEGTAGLLASGDRFWLVAVVPVKGPTSPHASGALVLGQEVRAADVASWVAPGGVRLFSDDRQMSAGPPFDEMDIEVAAPMQGSFGAARLAVRWPARAAAEEAGQQAFTLVLIPSLALAAILAAVALVRRRSSTQPVELAELPSALGKSLSTRPITPAGSEVTLSSLPRDFGQYRLIEKIGTGGMAEVYKAIKRGPEGFTKLFVIKRILPHVAEDKEFVQLFIQEARLSAGLSHGNVVPTFDFGETEGTYYLAQEFIHGKDLHHTIRRGKDKAHALDVSDALYIASETLKGLGYAHGRKDAGGFPLNIVHRDISPSNILLSYDGEVKVIDFGIAKVENAIHVTRGGAVKGKAMYMPPEQAVGKKVDARADLFAVAMVLYTTFTARTLYSGETIEATLGAAIQGVTDEQMKHIASLGEPIGPILVKGLQKDPEQRYASAAEFLGATSRALGQIAPGYGPSNLGAKMRALFADEMGQEQEALQRALAV